MIPLSVSDPNLHRHQDQGVIINGDNDIKIVTLSDFRDSSSQSHESLILFCPRQFLVFDATVECSYTGRFQT